jgi:hypothetical protein
VPGFSYSTLRNGARLITSGSVDASRVSSQSECGSLSAAQTATNVESTKTSENASTHAGAPTMAPALTRAKAVENRTISLTAADRVTEATGASFSTAIEKGPAGGSGGALALSRERWLEASSR